MDDMKGFTSSSSKPPLKLPSMWLPISVSPATFYIGLEEEETMIVTNDDLNVISWNFHCVKNDYYNHRIKWYSDSTVANNLKFAQDRLIIAALPPNRIFRCYRIVLRFCTLSPAIFFFLLMLIVTVLPKKYLLYYFPSWVTGFCA